MSLTIDKCIVYYRIHTTTKKIYIDEIYCNITEIYLYLLYIYYIIYYNYVFVLICSILSYMIYFKFIKIRGWKISTSWSKIIGIMYYYMKYKNWSF